MTTTFRKHVFTLLGERYREKTLVLCPTVFVKLLGGDHKAAILLSQILYWSDKTKDKDGWFYKSYADWQLETGLSETQVRRIVNGDARAKAPQRPLRQFGVETLLRKVKRTGAPTLHYRINQPLFMAALQAFLDPEHFTPSTPDNAGDERPAMPGMNADQSAGTQIPPEISHPEESTTDQPSDQGDEDLAIFHQYGERFGKLKAAHAGTFREQLTRLGTIKVAAVLERCATRGRSWNYVLRALSNEATPEVTAESLPDESYAVQTPFSGETASDAPEERLAAAGPASARLQQSLGETGATAEQLWSAVYHQLELQLDRSSFASALIGARLVDYEPETQSLTVVAATAFARELLQQRLARMVRRVLTDLAGQPLVLRVVLAGEWDEHAA